MLNQGHKDKVSWKSNPKTSRFSSVFIALAVSFLSISSANATQLTNTNPKTADGKIADIFWDWVGENAGRIRSETIGRGFENVYIGELSESQINELKASQGGDWSAVVTDWCNSMGAAQGTYPNIPLVTNTWRIDGGKANCYMRVPNGPF